MIGTTITIVTIVLLYFNSPSDNTTDYSIYASYVSENLHGTLVVHANCYPSDFFQPEMDICVTEINSGVTHTTSVEEFCYGDINDPDYGKNVTTQQKEQLHPKFNLLPGTYVVYAYFFPDKNRRKGPWEATGIMKTDPDSTNYLDGIKICKGEQTEVTLDMLKYTCNADSYRIFTCDIPPYKTSFNDYRQWQKEQKAIYRERATTWQIENNSKIQYVMSPDYRYTIYVEWSSEIDPYVIGDMDYYIQSNIMLLDNETGKASIIVPFKYDRDPQKNMQSFDQLIWSPDSKAFYFTTAGWATARAIQRYDMTTRKIQCINAGIGKLEIQSGGEYDGYLLTNHSEIVEDHGRQWYRVAISPDGKNVIRLDSGYLDSF